MAAAQRPYAAAAFAATPSAPPAWKTLPCWYLLGTEDKAIPPALQRFMAERANATIVEVPASHVSFVSQSEVATQLILQAVEATSAAPAVAGDLTVPCLPPPAHPGRGIAPLMIADVRGSLINPRRTLVPLPLGQSCPPDRTACTIRVNPALCGFLQAILHSPFRRLGGRPSVSISQTPSKSGPWPVCVAAITEARWSILRSSSCGVQPAISFLIRVQGPARPASGQDQHCPP